jgi:hypothetical protein
VNFNCDQCGLWQEGNPVYTNSFTVANSWESYYTAEWPYIQNGSTQAAALGIQNGILAGAWANSGGDNQIYANSLSGSGTPSYLSMLNWSYAAGIGFTSFHVWCGDNPDGLSQYKSLDFPQIVAAMQVYYPPTTAASLGTGATTQPVASAPAVCAQNNGSLDLFAEGTNSALYFKQWDSTTGWSASTSLGGVLASGPAAVSQGAGAIDVFVRGTDGAIWQKTTTNGGSSWSAGPLSAGRLPPAQDQRSPHRAVVSTSLYKARTAPCIKKRGPARVSNWHLPWRVPDLVTRCGLNECWRDRRLCARHQRRPL